MLALLTLILIQLLFWIKSEYLLGFDNGHDNAHWFFKVKTFYLKRIMINEIA